jgi:hypothetical protein
MTTRAPLVNVAGRIAELPAADTLPVQFAAVATNTFLSGPTTGGDAAPAFRAQVQADVPPQILAYATMFAHSMG